MTNLQLHGIKYPIKYEHFLNRSIWPRGETLKVTTTLDESGAKSNGNEGIIHIC